jgi:hypothetical protein
VSGHRNAPSEPEPPGDTRPFLCIPYWTTPLGSGEAWDNGQERPLPGGVLSYACDAIHAGPYTPGMPLDVSVDVRNSGGGNSPAIATVVVYWADPTVGFAKPNFFAASTVQVPTTRNAPSSATTPKMRSVIPDTAPDHICLLVSVSNPQDRAGTVCDAINDRHWAQHNLMAVHVGVDAPVVFPLTIANPFAEGRTLELVVGPIDERRASAVAGKFETEASGMAARLRLLNADGAPVSKPGPQAQISVQLGPLEPRRFQVRIEIDSDLPRGQSAAVEAQLVDPDRDRRPVGSLCVVLLPL